MKKIKDYFNKHHKLKKIASILGIAAIVLSFTFNAVILASAIYQNVQNHKTNQTLVYGDYKPIIKAGNISNNGNWFQISFGDFTNSYYLKGLLRQISIYANREASFENGFNDLSSQANGPINLHYGGLNTSYSFLDLYSIYYQTITDIHFTIMNSGVNNFQSLRVDFYESPNSAGFLGVLICFNARQFNNADFVLLPYTCIGYEIITYGHNFSSYDYTSYYCRDDVGSSQLWNIWQSYDYYIDDMLSNAEDIGYQDGYSTGHDAGYLEGREDGYDFGYSEGYDAGYDSGLNENDAFSLGYHDGYNDGETAGYNTGYAEGKTGISNNPFKLIANAFDAVASILNIQVLPNLSLGVLIFTPLIVMIIIVVVKFMRG